MKIVLVGDASVGKSCLIENYRTGNFNENYETNVLDVFRGPKPFKGRTINLEIHDTNGAPELSDVRQVAYNGTNCFMLCVAVDNRDSLNNVRRWIGEVRTICSEAQIHLVATKIDKRRSDASCATTADL